MANFANNLTKFVFPQRANAPEETGPPHIEIRTEPSVATTRPIKDNLSSKRCYKVIILVLMAIRLAGLIVAMTDRGRESVKVSQEGLPVQYQTDTRSMGYVFTVFLLIVYFAVMCVAVPRERSDLLKISYYVEAVLLTLGMIGGLFALVTDFGLYNLLGMVVVYTLGAALLISIVRLSDLIKGK